MNAIEESGITYKNEISEYAVMDSRMQGAQKAIGGASDTAQLALSYYWTNLQNNEEDSEDTKQLYENINVLAVIAQCAIDGCKRSFSVDPVEEIQRIRRQPVMDRDKDFPMFMKYTREIPWTKNNVERPFEMIDKDRKRLSRRIDRDIVCPMNWLEESFNKVQGMRKTDYVPTSEYFVWASGEANSRKMGKVREIAENLDNWITGHMPEIISGSESVYSEMTEKFNNAVEEIKGMSLSYITINHLIGIAIKADDAIIGKSGENVSRHATKILNLLYKAKKRQFLKCFIRKN